MPGGVPHTGALLRLAQSVRVHIVQVDPAAGHLDLARAVGLPVRMDQGTRRHRSPAEQWAPRRPYEAIAVAFCQKDRAAGYAHSPGKRSMCVRPSTPD